LRAQNGRPVNVTNWRPKTLPTPKS